MTDDHKCRRCSVCPDASRCQEPQPDLLTIVGGEGCCDDCIEAERAANEDPSESDIPFGGEGDVSF